MFKPHYDECKQCGQQPRLIVVKKGLCATCNKRNKSSKKINSGLDGRGRSGMGKTISSDVKRGTQKSERTVKRCDAKATGKEQPASNTNNFWNRRRILPINSTHDEGIKNGDSSSANDSNGKPGGNRRLLGRAGKVSKGDNSGSRKKLLVPSKKQKPIQRRRKRTGEKALFQQIAEVITEGNNEVFCQCCGARIPTLAPANFSHLLSKGAYPSFRLDKRNIWIKCEDCHHEWEFGNRDQPKFAEAIHQAEQLKIEYYQNLKR